LKDNSQLKSGDYFLCFSYYEQELFFFFFETKKGIQDLYIDIEEKERDRNSSSEAARVIACSHVNDDRHCEISFK